jgi:hypothetical protein
MTTTSIRNFCFAYFKDNLFDILIVFGLVILQFPVLKIVIL